MQSKRKIPKSYPGKFPPPPHIDLEERSKAMYELLDKSQRKKLGWKKEFLFALFSRIIKIWVEFTYKTCKQKQFIDPQTQALIDDPKGQFIIALWHNRLFYVVYSLKSLIGEKGHDILAIISQSDDGEFIARTTEIWGAFTVRGSSSRGGTKVIKQILKYAKLHFHPLITPDGPRGPVYQVQDGVLTLARLTGLPIVPMCYDSKQKWMFSSWDKFIVPKPFSRVYLDYGAPFYVTEGDDFERDRSRLETQMMEQVQKLETLISAKSE